MAASVQIRDHTNWFDEITIDAGSLNNPVINWRDCDVEYFNPISFCQYSDPGDSYNNIRINPNYIVK